MPLRAQILLPLPLPEAFDYAVPEGWPPLSPGDQVVAPLGPRQIRGVVLEVRDATGYNRPLKPLVEALDMRDAQRAYEANLSVIENARSMQSRTLDLLKK